METREVNWLLIRAIGIIVAYCIFGYFTPKEYVASIIGFCVFLVGCFVFSQYARKTYDILIHRLRGEHGGHLAILGTSCIGFGGMYGGFFQIIWVYFGSPPSWKGTAISLFSLFLPALGSYLIAQAPNAAKSVSLYPRAFWHVTAIILMLILAFVAGTHFSSFQPQLDQ